MSALDRYREEVAPGAPRRRASPNWLLVLCAAALAAGLFGTRIVNLI